MFYSIHIERFHLPANGVGVASVAAVTDVDHYPHLDAKGRASCLHREIVHTTDVQWTACRPEHGDESQERRPEGCED